MRSYFSTFCHSQLGKKEFNWRSSIQFMKDKYDSSQSSGSGSNGTSSGSSAIAAMLTNDEGDGKASGGSGLLTKRSISDPLKLHPPLTSSSSTHSGDSGQATPNISMITRGQHVGCEAVCNGSHMDTTVKITHKQVGGGYGVCFDFHLRV